MPVGPYKSITEKKVPVCHKMKPWLKQWLQDQDKSQSVLIEDALIKTYKLKPPKGID